MKIPMSVLRQSNGIAMSTIEYGLLLGGRTEKVEVVGTTTQLERWWAHTQRCIKRFGREAAIRDGRTITMYNVEHDGVLECPEVQALIARFER